MSADKKSHLMYPRSTCFFFLLFLFFFFFVLYLILLVDVRQKNKYR